MERSGYTATAADTASVPAGERAGYWRDHVMRNHGRLTFSFRDPESFTGGTRVQRGADLQLVDFWSSAVAYRRLPDTADGDESLRIVVPSSGAIRVTAAGTGHLLRPGAAAVVSMARGFTLEQDDRARALVLSVPRRLWPAAAPTDPLVWDLDRGAGAVFAAMLSEVSRQWRDLDAPSFVRTVESAAALISRGAPDPEGTLSDRARAVARRHCDDAGFTPADLARLLGWSLRSVQYALRREGTAPARLIRDLRLDRAASRLRHPDWAERTVSEIAHATGFGSLSAFNHAFRVRYGRTPLEHRHQDRGSQPAGR